MPKDLVLTFVDYPFNLCDGHIEFLSQWLKADSIYQPSFQDRSVFLV